MQLQLQETWLAVLLPAQNASVPNAAPSGIKIGFKPGTYTSTQTTPFATVDVNCTFSEDALSDVSYEVTKSSGDDYFPAFETALKDYCGRIVAAGTADGVDSVSGATLCTDAIARGVNECKAQALGITGAINAREVLNPQVDGYDTFSSKINSVLSPIRLGTMELSSRVIKSAGSSPWKDVDGSPIPVGTELYSAMSRGGVALIIYAGGLISRSGILPDSLEVKDGTVEDGIATVKAMNDKVHDGGAKIGFQMCFGGLAPTVPDEVINETPVEDLEAFVDRCGESAKRAKEAGFDCIEIKGASADGLNGFLTRRINKREDEYGPQSIENRTRLYCNMIRKIKEVNGADFPVGALMNAVEENDVQLGVNDGFMTIDESKEIARALVAAGADWIQLRVGANGMEMNIWSPDTQHIIPGEDGLTGYGTQFDYSTHYGGLMDGSRSGFAAFLPMVKEIKSAVDVPVGCAGNMDLRLGPDYLNKAIEDGDLDLIFMDRPLQVDQEIVNKLRSGDREAIRPCIKCMACHGHSPLPIPSVCSMNATQFHSLTDIMPEGMIPTTAVKARKVMVIGAGPAGLEAATVAAQRGHTVSIYDSSGKVGGLMKFARGVKGTHQRFEDYFAYAQHQLELNKVDVHMNTAVDLDTVKEVNPDAVIVAVGGKRESRLQGTDKIAVLSPEEAFGSYKVGNHVVILGGSVQAEDLAAYFVARGRKVTMIHGGAYADVGKGQGGWDIVYTLSFLQAKGTKIWNGASDVSLSDDGVTFTADTGAKRTIACDSVVECYDMVPDTELADAIKAAGYEVQTVGDCAGQNNIANAILSGNLAARAL